MKTLRLWTKTFLFVALSTLFARTQTTNAPLITNPIFEKNCAKCHGKTAEGRHFGGPSLVSDKVAATSTDELRSIITSGKGRMPKYADKLTVGEIEALVREIGFTKKSD
jgi:mono/diheme cytochrome c family protein